MSKKVDTTLVDFLFIELMSDISHVKQMYSQPKRLAHEFILCMQVTRRRVDINTDSAVKVLWLHQVLNLPPSDPDLLHFAAIPSLQNLNKDCAMSVDTHSDKDKPYKQFTVCEYKSLGHL